VIDEDEPQRQPAARIQPQVAAISIDVNGRNFGSPLLIGHDLSEPLTIRLFCAETILHIRVRLSASALMDAGTADDLIWHAGTSHLTEPIAATPIIAATLLFGEPR
jgi:hypothetical protein